MILKKTIKKFTPNALYTILGLFELLKQNQKVIMQLTEEDRKADNEIAEVINAAEGMQFREFNNEKLINIIKRADSLLKEYPVRVKNYLSDILDCLKGIESLYKEYNEKVPDILNSTIEGYQVK